MKFFPLFKVETLSSAYTTYSEAIDIASLGGDCVSVQAEIDVDTPSAVTTPSSDIDATTDEWTEVGHGLSTGIKVQLTTSSALPAPLLTATDYFIIKVDDDTFKIAASLIDALAGTAINLSDAGTGNQTVTPVALAGGTIKLQQSNDKAGGVWSDLGSATNVTADATVYLEKDRPTSRWVRVALTLTAGHITAVLNQLVKGDKE